ncbi:MAG: tetratricopeptide repeat protein [Bacteroidota bacterium]
MKRFPLLTKVLLPCLILYLANSVFAQKTTIYNNDINDYKLGLELFEKKKYGAAQKSFLKTVETINNPNSEIRTSAGYYAALCALELFNKDAEFMLTRFIKNHPENNKVRIAYFQLGKYKFRKKSYKKAIEWFQKVDVYDLDNLQLSEYYFKLGYSYFITGDYERARQVFYEIKDTETKYTAPAIYYYSHICYLNKNYETALQGFLKLSSSKSFAHIVPYYITQIYYLQQKHEKLLEYAPPLLDSANTKRAPEIARLIGEAYYATSQYAESIPFLKKYMELAFIVTRDDMYQLGYAYYKSDDYDKAISLFKKVVGNKDILMQNSFYHLGDCYLKKNKEKFARFAFRSASKFDFDKKIQEDASFNFAKLSYQLNLNPIFALKRYIDQYPNSERIDKAYEYLVEVYLTTKNYKLALSSLEKIDNKDQKLMSAYQRIAYFRGVELFNDQKLPSAIGHFDKSLTYTEDKNIEAFCHYWKGEAFYRQEMFDPAIESYDKFIYSPAAFELPVFNTVNYNLGYAYFWEKDYPNAITWFRKFVRDSTYHDIVKINDAYLRIADSYFVTKDYFNAIDYYDEAINLSGHGTLPSEEIMVMDGDYALFQKGLALGVIEKQDEKVSVLLSLLAKYDSSAYADDAKYELAKSYALLNQSDSALVYYNRVIDKHPNSSYVAKSMLNTGLVYYSKNENKIALVTFKRVINDYPATPEAMEALVGLKNIYIDMGDIDAYTKYVEGLTFANITRSSLDSTTYEAAELRYIRGDCKNAVRDFANYLEKFPDGFFVLNANFYKAECEFKVLNHQDALAGYHYVIGKPKNNFSEKSLMRSSGIHFNDANYEMALKNYILLEQIAEYKHNIIEARIGQMRCNFLLKEYNNAIREARRLIETEKAANEIINEAHFTIARSALETDNYNLALTEFMTTATATRSEMGAEAEYYAAYIQYLRSEHDESEKTIFNLINRVPSYDYWITKGFILLADNYVQADNTFQAKATLLSIIDNSENEELIAIARDKLNKILEAEQTEEQKKVQEEFEFEFENYDINYDKLFEEDEE